MKLETDKGPMLTDLSPLETIKKADEMRQQAIQQLIKQKESLLSQVAEIDVALASAGHDLTVEPVKRAGRRGRPKMKNRKGSGRKTMRTADAIVTALQNGKEMDKKTLTLKVWDLKGKVSQASIDGTLVKLVKSKAIKNPSRGMYRI